MREEFGRDAVILDTRLTRQRGIWGLLGRKYVEVTAALDTRPANRRAQVQPPAKNDVGNGITRVFNGI